MIRRIDGIEMMAMVWILVMARILTPQDVTLLGPMPQGGGPAWPYALRGLVVPTMALWPMWLRLHPWDAGNPISPLVGMDSLRVTVLLTHRIPPSPVSGNGFAQRDRFPHTPTGAPVGFHRDAGMRRPAPASHPPSGNGFAQRDRFSHTPTYRGFLTRGFPRARGILRRAG